ncbi:hypothetical protein FRB93_000979 [Tulasnella sp. JGI-2019a]|nr:hypothetical protein FRB93_000979 [Tulasnella sp. JGI-2019a]
MPWHTDLTQTLKCLTDHRDTPICPNLLSLELDFDPLEIAGDVPPPWTERWTPLLPLLVSPKLETITLVASLETKSIFKNTIQTLARIAPPIHTEIIHNNRAEYSCDCTPFTQLRFLSLCAHLNHDIWKALTSCSKLESVVLRETAWLMYTDPQI